MVMRSCAGSREPAKLADWLDRAGPKGPHAAVIHGVTQVTGGSGAQHSVCNPDITA
jgi:hypothetical protein